MFQSDIFEGKHELFPFVEWQHVPVRYRSRGNMILLFVEWQHAQARYRSSWKHDSCLCRVAACATRYQRQDSCFPSSGSMFQTKTRYRTRGNMILAFVEWQHVPVVDICGTRGNKILVFVEWQHVPVRYRTRGNMILLFVEWQHVPDRYRTRGNMILAFVEWQHVSVRYRSRATRNMNHVSPRRYLAACSTRQRQESCFPSYDI